MKKIVSFSVFLFVLFSIITTSVYANVNDDVININFSVENGSIVSRFESIDVTVENVNDNSIYLLVDGERCNYIDVSSLAPGKHIATVSVDKTYYKSIVFFVSDDLETVDTSDGFSISSVGNSEVFTGTLLTDVRLFENPLGTESLINLRCSDEVLVSFDDKAEIVTKAVGDSVPYHSFVVNTERVRSKTVVVSYTGNTGNGAPVDLFAWNYTNKSWDKIASTFDNESVSFSLDIENYSCGKKMRINAVPLLNFNDKIYWNGKDSEGYNIVSGKENCYDLISVGKQDLVVLYLQNNNYLKTISWANAICDLYSSRSVILIANGYFKSEYNYGENEDWIWNQIAVPNENVIAILSNDFNDVFEASRPVDGSERYIAEINTDKNIAYEIEFTDSHQMYVKSVGGLCSSFNDSFIYDLCFAENDRSIQSLDFNIIANAVSKGDVGDDRVSLEGSDSFYLNTDYNGETVVSKIYILKEYKNSYIVGKRAEYSQTDNEKIHNEYYNGISENLYFDDLYQPDFSVVNNVLDLIPLAPHTVTNQASIYEVGKEVDFDIANRLYFSVEADKYVKWNLVLHLTDCVISFADSNDISSQFGYPAKVEYINGSGSGYIDLSKVISGKHRIETFSLVSSTENKNTTFNYAFLGNSNGKKVRFYIDDDTSIAFEGELGAEVALPSQPYKRGYKFVGWYTAKDGGEEITNEVVYNNDILEIYARYSEIPVEERTVEYFDKEIHLERVAVVKVVFVCVVVIFMVIVICILKYKLKKSNNKENV